MAPAREATPVKRVGFVGLGTMGWPMFRHIVGKREEAGLETVLGFDRAEIANDDGPAIAALAPSLRELVAAVDAVHLCLPGGDELEEICRGDGGLLASVRPGQVVVDHGTSPVPLTRKLADAFVEKDVVFVDAPITRTRAAAESGTLIVLFGGDARTLERVRPAIDCFSEEIVHCGPLGAGQMVKQLNNMVLFQTVAALSEALSTARANGLDGDALFDALEKGSADSFALRNHGRKALLSGDFPERAFATRYALKDLAYAIELAESAGIGLQQAETTRRLFEDAIEAGDGEKYFPVILNRYGAVPDSNR
ncbi:MAG: NAD(P)-dependent oxidoreductase [Pseudomonadota bacterium]